MTHHITRKGIHIIVIRCKNCDTVIQSIIPHPSAKLSTTRKAGNVVIREQYVHMAPNNKYREFGIILQTSTKRLHLHISHCCDQCFKLLDSMTGDKLKMLQAWYTQDLDDEYKFTTGYRMPKETYDRLVAEKVIGVDLIQGIDLTKPGVA